MPSCDTLTGYIEQRLLNESYTRATPLLLGHEECRRPHFLRLAIAVHMLQSLNEYAKRATSMFYQYNNQRTLTNYGKATRC